MMSGDHEQQFRPRYLSIAEIRAMYQERDQPLSEATISAILDPLEGTSFATRISDELAAIWPVRAVRAHDVYGALYYRVSDLQAAKRLDEAAHCVFDLSGQQVPPENFYTMAWLEPDELM